MFDNRIEELKAFCPIGERFTYLGLSIVCLGHVKTTVFPSCGIWDETVIEHPVLRGQYVDSHGVIRDIELNYELLPILKAEKEL